MAEVRPFKGIRYNLSAVKEPAAVIAQPYDIISPADQEHLHQKNPYNIIRLEYGKSYPGNGAFNNRYTRAKVTFYRWLQEKILLIDPQPGFYFHEQNYTFRKQTYRLRSIFAALKLEPYTNRVILPHESTLAGPKEDRYKLLEATRANFSPIFTLAPDPGNQMADFFSRVIKKEPLFESGEYSSSRHRLWTVTEPGLLEEIIASIKKQSLLLADGHHRYETALNYLNRTDQERIPGAAYILAALVSIHDPGLLMLPTHRLLSGLAKTQKTRLDKLIADQFIVTLEADPATLDKEKFLAELNRISFQKSGFGYITPQKACLLTPKINSGMPGKQAPAVSVLHENLLNQVINNEIDHDSFTAKINFLHDFATALNSVNAGSADAAFIMGTFPVSKVFEETRQGRLLPQKSTYFFPKMPGGLVIYHMGKSL
ncbi:MAG: DUF1015 domain-containing protein [Bacillota bacterium]